MRGLYEEWESSGLSMKAFSLNHNINPTTFNYWVRSIRKKRQHVQSPGFLRLPIHKEAPDGARVATITFPSGIRLELYHPLEAWVIKELLR